MYSTLAKQTEYLSLYGKVPENLKEVTLKLKLEGQAARIHQVD